jgi:type IV pilus biogenesis protein CpaD/CtpE
MTMRLTALALLGACLQGCAQTTPRFDRQFGSATRANLAAQVLDPAAAANKNPATGIDGRAATGAHDRYQRSFAQPESTPPSFFINAGGR